MVFKFHNSPFHVTHDVETASVMALKMDLSMVITNCVRQWGLKQCEAAARLNIPEARIRELANGEIEKFTLNAMVDVLDHLGLRASYVMPASSNEPVLHIVIAEKLFCGSYDE